MTKYVTTEEQFKCCTCDVSCARRELKDDKSCPNCGMDFMTFLNMDGKLVSLRLVIDREPI